MKPLDSGAAPVHVPDAADAFAGAHAVGWATVELDRAARELGPLLRPGTVFRTARDSVVLGARCRVGEARGPGAPVIVLLEPSTEGRLAGALARYGEGWTAAWFRAPSDAMLPGGDEGPLGVEWLDRRVSASGPHRLLLGPATIGG